MIKTALKILVLFIALTLCSFCVVNIFVWIGLEFESVPKTIFLSSLLATVVLVLTAKKNKNRQAAD